MGNPHAVIFIEGELDDDKLNMYGAVIESHDRFPNKVNVEFVKAISKEESIVRVFERGVGITKSCGTGACAAVVAGTILGIFNENIPIVVHSDGGDLKITYTGRKILMEGPIVKITACGFPIETAVKLKILSKITKGSLTHRSTLLSITTGISSQFKIGGPISISTLLTKLSSIVSLASIIPLRVSILISSFLIILLS
ncbi:Diaminopimelate epimerase [subsurface metagenome]